MKITEEQLEKLQGHLNLINKFKLDLGGLVLQKQNILNELVVLQNNFQEFQKELQNEYGVVSINIEDGTYEPVQQEE